MMKWGLEDKDKEEMERIKRDNLTSAIQNLPPIWEYWTIQDLMKLSPTDIDFLFVWLRNKMDAVMDRYEIQVYNKKRPEVRKDKLVWNGTDGR